MGLPVPDGAWFPERVMGRSRRHRTDVEHRRKAEKEDARARETRLAQEAAAFRADWQHKQRKKVLAYVLFVLAAIVVVTHVLEHVGVFQLFNPGLEDLLIGYPTALLMLIAGAIALGTE